MAEEGKWVVQYLNEFTMTRSFFQWERAAGATSEAYLLLLNIIEMALTPKNQKSALRS